MSDRPLNFTDVRESFELAMEAHDGVSAEAATEVVATVDEAISNNERHLMWESDYEAFVGTVDALLDSIAGNGYDEQLAEIDDLRENLEPIDE